MSPLHIAPGGLAAVTRGGAGILVAEDNPINQEVIVEQLALLGYTAEVTGDGQRALDCWRRGHHALLLTDLQMPRLDGYQLAQAIRAHEAQHGLPRTTIVALTARTLKGEEQRCRQAGMDGHLTKPLDLGELKALLSKRLPPSAPGTRGPTPAGPMGDEPDLLLRPHS